MNTTESAIKTIGLKELKAKIDHQEKFHLWNVLNDDYYKPEANLPKTKRVPLGTLSTEVAAKLAGKKDAIVVYCGGFKCPASKQAAEKLVSLGYTNVRAFEGGIQEWSEAGLPLVRL